MRCMLFILILISALSARAEMEVRAHFLADSIKIGQPVELLVTATYPRAWQISFAENNYNFFPFHFIGKRYLTTGSAGDQLIDSVFYELTLFETDTIKWIRIPVYHLRESDSLVYWSDTAYIGLAWLIGDAPENAELKTHTFLQDVTDNLKYVYWAAGGFFGLILLVILGIVFGKKLKRYWLLRKLKQQYSEFEEAFHKGINDAIAKTSPEGLEAAYTAWKCFFEKVDRHPYTTYSTTEILRLRKDEQLQAALMEIDRAIYGKVMPPYPARLGDVLKDLASKKFQQEELLITYGRAK